MMRDFLCLFLAPAILGAQLLTVRVLDPSGAAVPRANVTITHRTTQETRTRIAGDSGESTFEEVRPGSYIVQADAKGFGASEVKQVDIQSQGLSSVELILDLARLTTHVQVTATGTAQTVDEQSKALDVIDRREIDRRLEYSVAEAVRAVAGIRVQQFGGPGSLVRILARGMRPSDTSILVDGFRFRDAAAPQGDVSAFAGDLLIAGTSRIEVLRGSGSSLYGTHATGGIVNVITDQGGGAFRGEIGAEGGGLSLAQGFARFSGGARSDRLRYSGAAQHLNVMKGLDGDDRARNLVGQVFIHGQVGSRTAIQGRLLASDNFAQLNDSPYDLPAGAGTSSGIVPAEPDRTFVPSSNDPDMRRGADYFSGLLSLSHALTSRAFTRLSFHHVTSGRDTRDGPAGTRFEPLFNDLNRFDGDIDTVEARTDVQVQNHLITAGYEFERERFDNVSQDENPDQAARVDARVQIAQHSHTAFVHDQMRLFGERLLVSLSGRMQQFESEHPTFSGQNAPYQGVTLQTPPRAWTGDASISHFWRNSGTKLRAHAGNSYRAPALFERFGASFFFGSFSAFGDPNLAPERIVAFDAGVDQYFAGSRVRLSSTYFYTRLQEAIVFDFSGLIVPDTDPYGRFGGYRNTGGGIARGVELTVEARPSRSTILRTAYTYTNADERRSVFRDGTLRSVRVSDHMVTVTATQRIARNLDVTADVFAASNYLYGFGDRAFEFDGPLKADIAAVYTMNVGESRALQIYTRIENLLNRIYFEDGFRTPKTWAVAGMKLLF